MVQESPVQLKFFVAFLQMPPKRDSLHLKHCVGWLRRRAVAETAPLFGFCNWPWPNWFVLVELVKSLLFAGVLAR